MTDRTAPAPRGRVARRVAAALLLLALGAGGGWLGHDALTPPPPAPPPVPTAALDSLDARLSRLRAGLERLEGPRSDEDAALRRPSTPGYSDHRRLADSLGIPPVTDERDLARLVRAGRLVPLADGDGYVVRVLEHSKPFVTPATRDWLDGVAARFQARLAAAGLPPLRFVLSSALRTADLQADLRRTNRNATGGRSSHEYGVSVDFDYSDYRAPAAVAPLGLPAADRQGQAADRLARRATDDLARAYWVPLWGELTRVLADEQREDRALVLLENEQPVFHVTVGHLRPASARREPNTEPEPPEPDSSDA